MKLRNILEQEDTIIDKQKIRLTWLCNVERMEDNRLPHRTLHCYIEGLRSRGRQRKTWIDNVKEDLEKRNADIEAPMELIRDRWKKNYGALLYCT